MKLTTVQNISITILLLLPFSGSGADIPLRPPTTREQTVRPVPMPLDTPRITAINFMGHLQSAETIAGTWTDVEGATNQYVVPAPGETRFYRALE